MNSCILSEITICNICKCRFLYKVNVPPKQRRGKKKIWKDISQYICVWELFPSFATGFIMQRFYQVLVQTHFFLFCREEYVSSLKMQSDFSGSCPQLMSYPAFPLTFFLAL